MVSSAANSGHVFLVGCADVAAELETVLSANLWKLTRYEGPSGVLRRLRSEPAVDLVVLTPDASFDSYTTLCREIKFDARTTFVSVIFVVPYTDAERRADVFEAGADDCIQLPASSKEILLRFSNALRTKRATDSLEDSTAVITSLASAIEGRDAYTHGHVERVAAYAVQIGKRVGVDADGLAILRIGGIVHDIGKVLVPDAILNKPGKLTDVEFELVKRHPVVGYDILQPLRTFRDVLPIVRWHHERPNGTGYPDGLEGDQFPLFPRIMAVADVFDAVSTARPYRTALSLPKCKEILCDAAEKDDLDPSLVTALIGVLGEGAPIPGGTLAESTDRVTPSAGGVRVSC